ncbi:alkane 1-monooxygenase [Rhodococcus spelaei]|uniref:Alkane 1-monooxygenase n=1 Tax=Rhodococcus spelaei TaxID=2546320 RepID=A0A541BA68_9NOCA|nr:alkane 1-monooxygenase [Rhodococcus spelaei]TQF69232.1 alkane 1-monooxygenase [Rhodococcus spelaei]
MRGVGSSRAGRGRGSWRSSKRHLWLLGLMAPLSPFVAWLLVRAFGLGLFWAAGVLLMAVVIPLVDVVAGVDKANPPDEAMTALENDRFYRWCTYLYLPVQYAGLVFACYLWTTAPMGWPERLAMAATVGVVAGIGINAAHELGHKRPTHERWLAKIALAQSLYGHFYVEHNHGHHLRVATPEDPATARFGESFWAFLPRSVTGGVGSAWRHERDRLARRGERTWSPRNDVLNAWAMSVALFAVLIAVFGWSVAPWLLVQAVIGFALLESANYLEHYGLLRAKLPSGRYERVAPEHSWNSDHLCSNLFLYHLQRHSDHHANPLRRYQTLRSMPEAPQLPAGYATLIWLSFVPPLWRRVMDPRLLAHYGGDLSLVNVVPGSVVAPERVSAGR